MIQMGMRKENVDFGFSLRNQLVTQFTNTGTGINNNHLVVSSSQFDAGRITSVFEVFHSRNGN